VLDIFLAKEFLHRRGQSKLEHISKQTVEDLLKDYDIQYDDSSISKGKSDLKTFTAESKEFEDKEIGSLKNQKAKIIDFDKTKISSDLIKPVPIQGTSKNQLQLSLKKFAEEYLYGGSQYIYWKDDKEKNSIELVQVYQGEEIYDNEKAKVILKYDENRQIISYTQTMIKTKEALKEIDKTGKTEKKEEIKKTEDKIKEVETVKEVEEQKQISALKALESLIIGNEIKSNSKIESVDLGYYRFADLADVQIMGPVWYFVLEDQTELYVHAIEGTKIKVNEENVSDRTHEIETKGNKKNESHQQEELIPEKKYTN
jgi:regulatory protein YycI of two-component signal transduction system YycFG